jgi:hypothetical protein
VSCTKHLWRVNASAELCSTGNSGPRKGHALETLVFPHSGPLKASGLCSKTLLVRVRLGGGAATRNLGTDHQGGEQERQSKQTVRLRVFRPDTPSQSVLYIEGRSIRQALPVVGQLDGGLRLSPQRLRGDKALEVKHLFPREHVVHRTAQLVCEYGERFGFAMFVFEFRKIFFARLIVA